MPERRVPYDPPRSPDQALLNDVFARLAYGEGVVTDDPWRQEDADDWHPISEARPLLGFPGSAGFTIGGFLDIWRRAKRKNNARSKDPVPDATVRWFHRYRAPSDFVGETGDWGAWGRRPERKSTEPAAAIQFGRWGQQPSSDVQTLAALLIWYQWVAERPFFEVRVIDGETMIRARPAALDGRVCTVCATPVQRTRPGRHPLYCSVACRRYREYERDRLIRRLEVLARPV